MISGHGITFGRRLLALIGMAESIGRHLQYVLRQSNQPAHEDRRHQGGTLELQVPVPGDSHKCVGANEQDDGKHGVYPPREQCEKLPTILQFFTMRSTELTPLLAVNRSSRFHPMLQKRNN
jgi:hypothetical protein